MNDIKVPIPLYGRICLKFYDKFNTSVPISVKRFGLELPPEKLLMIHLLHNQSRSQKTKIGMLVFLQQNFQKKLVLKEPFFNQLIVSKTDTMSQKIMQVVFLMLFQLSNLSNNVSNITNLHPLVLCPTDKFMRVSHLENSKVGIEKYTFAVDVLYAAVETWVPDNHANS